MRKTITTSAPSMASSMRLSTRRPPPTASEANSGGASVPGPASETEAPSVVRRCAFERATREWSMSPRMATLRPRRLPFCWRMVNASSRACVGCSCAPSPALTTPARQTRASWCGAPAEGWRMTMRSGDIASRLRAVSSSVSPFVTDEEDELMLITSAERRLPAISKEVRVRVEGSKKRLMTVRPRSVGTFLISRSETSRNVSAVSRMCVISSALRPRMPSRCFWLSTAFIERVRLASPARYEKGGPGWPPSLLFLARRSLDDGDRLFPVEIFEHHLDDLALFSRHELADEVRLNRKLAVLLAAVNEDGELDAARPAEVNQLVERRADGAPRVEHVVNEEDVSAFDINGQVRAVDDGVRADGREVVAVERDVHDADGRALAFEVGDLVGQAMGERHAAPLDADEVEVARAVVLLDDLGGEPGQRAVDPHAVHDARFLD